MPIEVIFLAFFLASALTETAPDAPVRRPVSRLPSITQIKAPQKNIKVVLKGFKDAYKVNNTDHLFIEKEEKERPVAAITNGTHKELLRELSVN